MQSKKHAELIYDTMGQAGEAYGLSRRQMRWCKLQGCPGFKNSRVYDALARPWIESRRAEIPDDGDDLDRAIKTEKLRRIRFENDVLFDRYVEKEHLASQLAALTARLNASSMRHLTMIMPAKCQGMSAVEIAKIGESVHNSFVGEMQAFAVQWGAKWDELDREMKAALAQTDMNSVELSA